MEKTVLKAGQGLYRPNEQAKVIVNLLGKWQTLDGSEHVFDIRENHSMIIDEAVCPLSQALEDAICSMKMGEQCSLKLTMDTTLATSPILKAAPINECTLLYTVALVSLTRAPEVWSLSLQNRLTLASQHKATGTEQFKLNNMHGASLHYSKALKYIISVVEAPTLETNALRKTLYLNLAACQLKLKLYSNVVRNCSCVLESGPNVKALYRRGQGLQAMHDFEGAKQDYLNVLELEPNNNTVIKLLHQLELEVKALNSKFGGALKEMFSS